MRSKVVCFLTSIVLLAVAGCSGGSSTPVAPTVTWAAPASIVYGTALSSTQLDASASAPGTFTYSPAAGTVLKAGAQTLSVTFTPTDASKYTGATGSVTLTVTQATPVVTWTTPASITYGTALGAAQLDATASVPGAFVYSPAAGQVPIAGNQSLSVTFTPTDATDYTTPAAQTVQLTVNKATPTVTWTAPTAITYGTALSATQLDATASVPGAFVYSPAAGQIPVAGSQNLSVTFTPTDATDYNTPAAQTVQLTVGTAAFDVTCPSVGMTFGNSVPGLPAVVTGEVTGDGITATCSTTATSSSPVGSYPITGTLNDPNSKLAYYTVTNTPGTLTVSKATPVITWTTPAAVTQGATLGSTQLDATASNGVGTNVPGKFVYTPASGTVLNTIGPVQLSTTFTPTDATDYTTANGTVSLTVSAPGVTVDFGTQEQLIRGFGGSTAWLGQLTQAQANTLFSQSGNGLGLSILRMRIDYTGTAANNWVPTNKNWGQEVTNAKEAVAANPNAIAFASPWTPPTSMKTSSTSQPYTTGCTDATGVCGGYLNPTSYADYAAYLEDFVTYFNANAGFNLYAISMQNEPDWPATYEACLWTPAQMDAWVASLTAGGATNPLTARLIMPESLDFNPAQGHTALADSNAAPNISVIGGHLYQFGEGVADPSPYPTADSNGRELWMTEHYQNSAGDITDALGSAEEVHNSLVDGNYNAYVWWWIWNDPGLGVSFGLINSSTTSPAPTNFGYGIGHFSKFVQPGYYRYDATANPSGNLFVSAYAGMESGVQHYVIVAINGDTTAVNQPFTIQNGTVTSLTPYQTTASGGLAPQSAITVSGDTFTYNLPAQSITTFVQ